MLIARQETRREPRCPSLVKPGDASANHPVNDCVYLALAHRIGAVMLTADRQFVTVVAPTEHGKSGRILAESARTR